MKTNYWHEFEVNKVYHIYNRSVSNRLLFEDQEDYELFFKLLAKYTSTNFKIIAYCLIDNHFHIIAKCKPSSRLKNSDFVNCLTDVFRSFSKRVNFKRNQHGALFQERFKRIKLKNVDNITDKICYVHHNPIHHGLTSYYDYEFSSYNEILTAKSNDLVDFQLSVDFFNSIDGFILEHKNYQLNRL